MRERIWGCGLSLALLLSACGGGGGDSSAESRPSGTGAVVSFSPSPVKANVAFGTSATVNVLATVLDPSAFTQRVYVVIEDTAQVLSPAVEISETPERNIVATLHTLPTLGAGRHQGTLQVHLCLNLQCSSEVRSSPLPLPYDIEVAEGALTAQPSTTGAVSIHEGELSLANLLSVAVSGPSGNWLATTQDSWLSLTRAAGTSSGSFDVGIDARGLTEGRYQGAIKVSADNGQTIDVPVSLSVLPKAFALLSGVPTFSAINGAPIDPASFSFQVNNLAPFAWEAASSAAWLPLATTTGTGTVAMLTLQPDPSLADLASGAHTADVTLRSSGVPDLVVSTQLNLSKASLTGNLTPVTFGGPKGRDMNEVDVNTLRLNTGPNSWPYALAGVPAWLTVTPPVGFVDQDGVAVRMSLNTAGVTPGSKTAVVSMRARVNGDYVSATRTVNINADQRRLLASEWAIALADSAAGRVLTRTVQIRDGFGGALDWQATSDAPWLQVTATGNTEGQTQLELRADPLALPPEDWSQATVKVTTSTPGVEPAVIRVGMWHGAVPRPQPASRLVGYTNMVADKLRPYVYANNNGPFVDVYNAYTGMPLGKIDGFSGNLGDMAVSADGSRLYALIGGAMQLAVFNLATNKHEGVWQMSTDVSRSNTMPRGMQAVRTNGVDLVILANGEVYHASGRYLAKFNLTAPFAVSQDGRKIYDVDTRHDIDYSEMAGGLFFVSSSRYFTDGPFGLPPARIALSRDGNKLYKAAPGGHATYCNVVDLTTRKELVQLSYPDTPRYVAVAPDGRVICGGTGESLGQSNLIDFALFNPEGGLLGSFDLATKSQPVNDVVLTPDGLVAVLRAQAGLLAFVHLTP